MRSKSMKESDKDDYEKGHIVQKVKPTENDKEGGERGQGNRRENCTERKKKESKKQQMMLIKSYQLRTNKNRRKKSKNFKMGQFNEAKFSIKFNST